MSDERSPSCRRSPRFLAAAVALFAVLQPIAPLSRRAAAEEKPAPGEKPVPDDEPTPAEKPVPGEEPAPGEKPVPGDEPAPGEKRKDDPALARMRTFVSDLQKVRNRQSEQGLGLAATLIPDLFAFEVGRRYLKARDEGLDEVDAEDRVISELKDCGKLDKRSGLRLTISNAGHELPGGAVRIFTLQGKFPGEALRLLGLSKRSTEERKIGRPLPALLMEKPSNLRRARVRIKKFWKLRKRGSPPRGDPDPADPQSRFKDPILSDPFPVLLVEEKPVELTLVVSKATAAKYEHFELVVAEFKKYEGPFRKNLIDLNGGRTWKSIRSILVPVDLPPEGHEVPEDLEILAKRIRRKL